MTKATNSVPTARLAIDIGGTFTDIALQCSGRLFSTKVVTTPSAPEAGALAGVDEALRKAELSPTAVHDIIHGTTLATNALIERKGARTALLVTEGFRDAVEIGLENRFEQYDLYMDRPAPLVPRTLRLPVPERIDGNGRVVAPLDEGAVRALIPVLRKQQVQSVAVGFLHSYLSPVHELRTAEILQAEAPDLLVTLSSEVCPEIREYERWSTACANAYVQPVMAGYLERLAAALAARGFDCPLFLVTSGGSLTSLETARRFPVRLVESGPAGGAILAAHIAQECGFSRVLSLDVGGTTAKLCLIDEGKPLHSRRFEVAREYRFLRGSGLPLRIPVIEMVEIGAGGGSIASVDTLGRLRVGPDSAGSEPGPACYARGGTLPTITDANLLLGRLDAERFAGGTIRLDKAASEKAVRKHVANALAMATPEAAYGVCEIVEENMANAARVHAVEQGKETGGRTLIAFGGAAPLHAARLADKLGIDRVLIPAGAAVGSALGFLLAPVAYEVVRTRLARLDGSADMEGFMPMFEAMRAEARAIVHQGASDAELAEEWSVDMRYIGQGHEVNVPLSESDMQALDADLVAARFADEYARAFGRTIPGLPAECLNWTLRLTALQASAAIGDVSSSVTGDEHAPPTATSLYDPIQGAYRSVPVYRRTRLRAETHIKGPALIAEDGTSTVVPDGFGLTVDPAGHLVLVRNHCAE